MSSYNIYDIAKYIIWKYYENDMTITNLRLQKLLYYVQGYSLKMLGKPAFLEDILHWAYGPVVADVYYEYCAYGSAELPCPDVIESDKIDAATKQIIDQVLNATNKLHVGTLIEMTLTEAPWRETANKETISLGSIKRYFEEYDPLSIQLFRWTARLFEGIMIEDYRV